VIVSAPARCTTCEPSVAIAAFTYCCVAAGFAMPIPGVVRIAEIVVVAVAGTAQYSLLTV
jgi:hypothetical protein